MVQPSVHLQFSQTLYTPADIHHFIHACIYPSMPIYGPDRAWPMAALACASIFEIFSLAFGRSAGHADSAKDSSGSAL